MRRSPHSRWSLDTFRIVLIYVIVGGLWIYLSDTILGWLIRDHDTMTRIAVFKGLLFIALTASILYYLIRSYVKELSASEENLKALMELMPVGVAWSDSDGRIEYLNKYFVERFAYTLSDIPTVDQWYVKAYPDQDYRESILGRWSADLAKARISGTLIQPIDANITCKDGTVRHVIINAQLAQNRTLVIFTDITERENLQNDRVKTQKLESLGVLAGGIAHDFNNVLTAIMGNISMAQIYLDSGHKSAKPLRDAEKATQRAAELAHQLLTFAKGGQPITKAVSAKQLIQESVSLVLSGSNVKGVLEIPDFLHAIEVDEGQMNQVVNNLIINAVQAMPGGGTITISAENVTLDEDNPHSLPAGEYVKLIFSDKGCGIAYEEQKRIFDPYFTTKVGGSGLGLASTHSIVCKHGGSIDVRSKVGSGTTFEILLPSAGERDEVLEIGTEAHFDNQQDGVSVLVMDDDEMILELISEMLTHLGYQATTCSNGEEAAALYVSAKNEGKPFTAVIMDLTIPGGMGGKESAERILAIDPAAWLIVSSGYSNDPIMAEFETYGFKGAIAKPYKITEIDQALREIPLSAAS